MIRKFVELVLLSAAIVLAFRIVFKESQKVRMPPGYTLQTDGINYRFIGLERGTYFTNYDNGGAKYTCINEAWSIYRANRHSPTHEYKDVK